MKRIVMATVLAALMIMDPMGVVAQVRPGGPPRQGRNRQELERRVMQGFQTMIQERLGLDQEQLAAVQGVMGSFREDRQRLNRDQGSLRQALRMASVGGMDEARAQALLTEMVRVQEVELELYRREQAELLTVLTPVQLVQFYQVREDFGTRIQELRQGRGGRGGPSGGTWDPDGGTGAGWEWGGFFPGLR